MLSSLSYRKIIQSVHSRAIRHGVEVIDVNPAYTSLIGRIKYAVLYGLTIHASAALAIARRGLGFSEKVPRCLDKIPDGKGSHIALKPPVRKGLKHEGYTWKQLHKKISAELAAHAWAIKKNRSFAKPLKGRAKRRATPSSASVKPRYANRNHHGSG